MIGLLLIENAIEGAGEISTLCVSIVCGLPNPISRYPIRVMKFRINDNGSCVFKSFLI